MSGAKCSRKLEKNQKQPQEVFGGEQEKEAKFNGLGLSKRGYAENNSTAKEIECEKE